jgi:hypothetical protein
MSLLASFDDDENHDMICRRIRAIQWAPFQYCVLRIVYDEPGLLVYHNERNSSYLV